MVDWWYYVKPSKENYEIRRLPDVLLSESQHSGNFPACLLFELPPMYALPFA